MTMKKNLLFTTLFLVCLSLTGLAQERTNALQQDVELGKVNWYRDYDVCLLYTSPSPRDRQKSRMPSSA